MKLQGNRKIYVIFPKLYNLKDETEQEKKNTIALNVTDDIR